MQQPTAKVDWNKKSYYEVLDVPKDANTAQIKKAYYKMARQYHPDQSEDPNADEIFKCINEAYHVLIDEDKRLAYDKYGKDGVAQAEGGVNPIDIMKAMFGGDAFSDTFGDLNLWEALTLQLMAATGGTEMSEEEFRARLQKHAEDRHHKLVEALVKKIASFVRKDIEQFKKEMDADVAEKVAAPGGIGLLAVVGYAYCQVAQQYMDRFLGLGNVFAKIAEKGHRFKNNMSALGTAVKYAYSQAKLQQRLEQEEMDRMRKWEKEHPEEPYPGPEAYEAFEREKKAGGAAGGAEGHTYETYDFENDPKWKEYERNVEIPESTDRAAAMEKVRQKWYDKNIAAARRPEDATREDDEAERAAQRKKMEEELLEDKEVAKVFDQGLKVMWKFGMLEVEDITREVVRDICDPKSEYNVVGEGKNTNKEDLKRRVMAIHHIGEKYRDVAAKLKKDEKGFGIQELLDQANNANNNNNNGNPKSPRAQQKEEPKSPRDQKKDETTVPKADETPAKAEQPPAPKLDVD